MKPCTFCKYKEAEAFLSDSKKSQIKFWKKRMETLKARILDVSDFRLLHLCSYEHRASVIEFRRHAQAQKRDKVKELFEKIRSAYEQLAISQRTFMTLRKSNGSLRELYRAESEVNRLKKLIGQRQRRLKELLPYVPDIGQLIDTKVIEAVDLMPKFDSDGFAILDSTHKSKAS